MKRLLKKQSAEVVRELDKADVKSNRCPNCKHQPLRKKNGFQHCQKCNNVYKVFKNKVYLVVDRGEINDTPTPPHNNIS